MERIKLSYSNQIYLDSIYRLGKREGYVRSVDIASDMRVSKPSVTRAVKILIEQGMVDKNSNGKISLTAAGKEAAEYLGGRCKIVKKFFCKTIDKYCVMSDQEAGRVAYAMSDEMIEKMKDFTREKPAFPAAVYF